jgi:hypothetical protein
MKNGLIAACLALAALAAPLALGEGKADDVTDMQALRAAVKADKRALVASTLKLTDAEAKRFWPIYDTFQRNLDMNSRRRVIAVEGLLFRDKPMTNLAAKNVITELMTVDEAEVKARHTLRRRLMRALPPIKAAQYLQLEDKIQAVQDYDIAATVPLIR